MKSATQPSDDTWDRIKKGAQARSHLFKREIPASDYSNRNLKASDSILSMPSPRDPIANTMTFQENFHMNLNRSPIFSGSDSFHRKDFTFLSRSPRIFFDEDNRGVNETWKKGAFKIIGLLFRFKNNLKQRTFNFLLNKLRPNQMNFLGDRTFFLDSYQEISRLLWLKKLENLAAENSKTIINRTKVIKPTNFKKTAMKTKKFGEYFKRVLGVFRDVFIWAVSMVYKTVMYLRPDLKTRIFWDITLIIILTKQMWYIPVYASFNIANESPALNLIFQTVPLIILSIDILFNFVTGYYSKGLWVTEKKRIARHYLKKEFWIDVTTLIPLYLAYFGAVNPLFALLFMLRVVRISKMFRKIEDHFQLQVHFSSILNLSKLAIVLLFIVHIFSCYWNLVAEVELFFNKETYTWLHSKEIENDDWFIKYMASFYFALVTSVTVGYGDITPQTSFERLCSCVIILFGCGQNAYSINSIGAIFQDMFKEETFLKQQIATLTAYMNKRNVESSLQIKARRYLEYVNQQEKHAYQKGESILSSLSSSLRAEILKSIYYKTFKKDIPFFADNFSDDCIDSLMLRAKEVSFAPEELIFRQNELEDPCLYFIIKGKVEIYLDLKRVFLQMACLGQGKTFGEKEFVLGSPREFCVRSLECSRLIYITRKDFLEVLKSFPDDNEKFLMIKDTIVFDGGNCMVNVNETCYFCDSKTHSVVKCPFLGYHPKKELLLGNWFHSTQKRRRCFRTRVFKTNSLKKKRMVVVCAGKYQDPQSFPRKNQEFFEDNNNERIFLQKNVSYEYSHQENDPQTMVFDNEELFMKASLVESRKPSFIQQRKILEIDKGKNYKCYFPWDNVDQFVVNLRNPENIAKKIYGKTKRRMTSPKKAGLLASALVDARKASSFSKANLLINKGCLWFKRQWPFKNKQ